MSEEGASDVDSELAAILDEELFQEDAAAPDEDPAGDAAADGPEQQQQQQQQQQQPNQRRDGSQAEAGSESGVEAEVAEDEEDVRQRAAGYICPPHPAWWNDMCVRCGAIRPAVHSTHQGQAAKQQPSEKAQTTKIKHLHHKTALEVSADEAARIASGSLQQLIAQKRLVLVLDLDHTLLNTVRDVDLQGKEREAAIKQLEQQHQAMQQARKQQQQQPTQQQEEAAATSEQPVSTSPANSHSQQPDQQQQRQEEGQGQAGTTQPMSEAAGAAKPPGEVASGSDHVPGQQHLQEREQAAVQGEPAGAAAAATTEAAAGPGGSSRNGNGFSSVNDSSNGEGSVGGNGNGSSNGSSQPDGPRAQLYYFRDKGLWTKLRPGVAAFLSAVSKLYELHIYTMGDKGYAGLMADVLDPQHKLFVGRVISAADSTRAGMKDLDVLMADESLVLILDDSHHVWVKHQANLIQVERYHYFNASVRLWNSEAVSTLEQGTDEPEQGGMLDNAAQLLARIHTRVYGADAATQQEQNQQHQEDEQQEEQQQPAASAGIRRVKRRKVQPAAAAGGGSGGLPAHKDVRECLEAERRGVLAGCRVVFSRCWPQQEVPQAHPLWLLAERLGASCSLVLQPGTTTHLVVAPDPDAPGNVPMTDKVQVAHKAGIPVVHPDWLIACRFAWKQLPAADFSLRTYSTAPGSSCCSSRLLGQPRSVAGAAAADAADRAAVMQSAGRTGP